MDSAKSKDYFHINQHAFRVVHIDGHGRRWGECQACRLLILTEHARGHVESMHGAVDEEMPVDTRQVEMFDERVADRTYPDKHSVAEGFKRWLIDRANEVRDELADKNGTVSSPEIQREMLRRYPEQTEGLEWRFLGGLWKGGRWTKTGDFKEASHGRMSPVWRRVNG